MVQVQYLLDCPGFARMKMLVLSENTKCDSGGPDLDTLMGSARSSSVALWIAADSVSAHRMKRYGGRGSP